MPCPKAGGGAKDGCKREEVQFLDGHIKGSVQRTSFARQLGIMCNVLFGSGAWSRVGGRKWKVFEMLLLGRLAVPCWDGGGR